MNRFSKFGVVGGLGFMSDAIVFSLLLWLIDYHIIARIMAFWCAATVTWLGNRYYTFEQCDKSDAAAQWGRHMLVAHLAGVFNLMMYYAVALWLPLEVAFIVGVGVGMIANYFLVSRLVYNTEPTYD